MFYTAHLIGALVINHHMKKIKARSPGQVCYLLLRLVPIISALTILAFLHLSILYDFFEPYDGPFDAGIGFLLLICPLIIIVLFICIDLSKALFLFGKNILNKTQHFSFKQAVPLLMLCAAFAFTFLLITSCRKLI